MTLIYQLRLISIQMKMRLPRQAFGLPRNDENSNKIWSSRGGRQSDVVISWSSTLVLFLLFISGAHALSIEKKGEDAVFKLTESDCRKLIIEHKPEPGVEYVPNVDVNGKPLTPVDVYGGYNKIDPEFIHIPLGAALDGYTDLARPINRLREGYVGQIDLNLKSGEIYYNGKPLQNDLVYSLRKSCRENFPNI